MTSADPHTSENPPSGFTFVFQMLMVESPEQGCRFFLIQYTKTQLQLPKLPNGYKIKPNGIDIYRMDIAYTKFFITRLSKIYPD
jgi:hypothetical protein